MKRLIAMDPQTWETICKGHDDMTDVTDKVTAVIKEYEFSGTAGAQIASLKPVIGYEGE